MSRSISTNDLVRWFRQVWPSDARRMGVLSGYAVIGQQKLALADIALRGMVYRSTFDPNPQTSAFQQGRQSLALEIIRLAGEDPAALYARIERGGQS